MSVSTPTVVPCRVVAGKLFGVSNSSRSPTPAVPGAAAITPGPLPGPVHAPNPANPTIANARIIIILY